jgi:hypothetical protein
MNLYQEIADQSLCIQFLHKKARIPSLVIRGALLSMSALVTFGPTMSCISFVRGRSLLVAALFDPVVAAARVR